MKNSTQILVDFEYLEMGLIPPLLDVNQTLSLLNITESTKMKRKFRKIFRKMLKDQYPDNYSHTFLKTYFGFPGKPSGIQQFRRKEFVHDIIAIRIDRSIGKSS